ncbi:MAG: acyl--CoA ligase [Clostridium sp.]|nr:acyl--CoA ligase [Clostridium sp.]
MKNLCEYLLESAEKYPEQIFVRDGENQYSYQSVCQKVKAYASYLVDNCHLQPNDKVVLYVENSIEYIVAYFAVMWVGGVVVPVNTVNESDMVRYVAKETEAVLIVVSGKKRQIMKLQCSEFRVLEIKYDSIQDSKSTVSSKENEEALIIYTSGTTDKPKGVVLSHQNLGSNTHAILKYLPIHEGSNILVTLSFTYSYGNSILLTHTKAGGTLYISHESAFPQKILEQLQIPSITAFSTVGSYLNVLMKQSNFTIDDFASLEYMTFAGEATSYDALIEIRKKLPNLKLYVMYGQTEASARISYLEPALLEIKKGSVGLPVEDTKVKIIDECGKEVPNGEIGELLVRGPGIMQGYYKEPELTSQTVTDGWLHTGDLAYLDNEAYLYIAGRKKDMIKVKGYRISPVEIENKINTISGVVEAAVVEETNEQKETIMAAYVVLSDREKKIHDIEKEARHMLPVYKRPARWYSVESIPKTLNGKVKRVQLRQKG